MTSVLALSGSPSANSRTGLVAAHLVRLLEDQGVDARQLAIRDLPADDLLGARFDSPAIAAATGAVAAADGIIVATPVYQASYTGLLKTFLDLLPQGGLAGKAVLPVATGGSLAHVLAIDYALRPVLSTLGARHVVAGCFLLDQDIVRTPDGGAEFEPAAELRLLETLSGFTSALGPVALSGGAGNGATSHARPETSRFAQFPAPLG